jgi:hypothetical protein
MAVSDPKIGMFLVFHNKYFEELYNELNEDDLKKIIMYGVKNKQESRILNVIYEQDFMIYNKELQSNFYNEGSGFWHLYKNKYLYADYDYIGFGQYDMKLFKNTFSDIINTINATESSKREDLIFVADGQFFPSIKETGFLGAHNTIHSTINGIPAGIATYNQHFGTNYTLIDVIENRLISCNTFFIHKNLFNKMMSWLEIYYIDNMRYYVGPLIGNGGALIEALIGMFLSLEVHKGNKYIPFNIKHIWPDYKILSNNCL